MTEPLIIETLSCPRFGLLTQRTLTLGPGLVLIAGPNEAGKSTARQALTWLLFGGGRRKALPVGRGDPEVTATMSVGSTKHVVERVGRRLTVQGREDPEEALLSLLGGLDQDTFEAVFSLDGFELVEATHLQGDRVKRLLVAGALTGSAASPAELQERLREGIKALTGPRTGQLKRLRDEVSALERALREAHQELHGYASKRQAQSARQEEVAALKANLRALTAGAAQAAALERAQPDWLEWQEATARLATLPPAERQPQGAEALAQAFTRLTEQRQREALAVARWASRREALEALPRNRALVDQRAAIKAAPMDLAALMRRVPTLGAQVERAEEASERARQALGLDALPRLPDWALAKDDAERFATALAPALGRLPIEQERCRRERAEAERRQTMAEQSLAALTPEPAYEAVRARVQACLKAGPRVAQARVELAQLDERRAALGGAPRPEGVASPVKAEWLDQAEALVRRMAQADAQYQAALDKAIASEQEATERVAKAEAAAAEHEESSALLGLHEALIAAEVAAAELPKHREAVARHARAVQEAEGRQGELLASVGASEAELAAVDLSAGAEVALEEVERAREAVERRISHWTDEQAELAVQRAVIPAVVVDEAGLARRQGLLTQAEAAFAELAEAEAAAGRGQAPRLNALPLYGALAICLALALMTQAWGVALGLGGSLALLAFLVRRAPATTATPDLSGARARCQEAAVALGVPGLSRAALVTLKASHEQDRERQKAALAQEARRAELAQREEGARAQLRQAVAEREALGAQRAAAMERAGLPAKVTSPRLALRWQAAARQLATLTRARLEAAAALNASQVAVDQVTQQAAALAKAAGLKPDTPESELAQVRRILDDLRAGEERRRDARARLAAEQVTLASAKKALAELRARSPYSAELKQAMAALSQVLGGRPVDEALVGWLKAALAHERAKEALARLDATRAALVAEILAEEQRISAVAGACGLEGEPDVILAGLELRERRAVEEEARRPDARAAWAQAVERHQRAKDEQAALAVEAQRVAALEAEFARWRASTHASESLRPDQAPRWLARLEAARQAAEQASAARQAWEDAQRQLMEGEREVKALAERLGETWEGPASAYVSDLLARLEQASAWEIQAAEREALLDSAADEKAVASAERAQAEREVSERWQRAFASWDAPPALAQWPTLQTEHAAFVEAEGRRQRAEANLVRQLGHAWRAHEAELDEPGTLGVRRQALEAEAQALQVKLEAALAAEGAEQEQLVRLSQDQRPVELGLQLEGARAELARLERQWQRQALASWLLERTFEQYRRDRQPEVLKAASEWFAAATGNAYERLEVDAEGKGQPEVRVVRPDGQALGAERLSAGARGLLYLCLRVALARSFAQHAAVLPLVLDDVLANLDPERAEGAVALLAEAAKARQVLLFTCRPETVALVEARVPGCHKVELKRFGGHAAPMLREESRRPRPEARTESKDELGELLELAEQALKDAGEEGMARADFEDALAAVMKTRRLDFGTLWGRLAAALKDRPGVSREGEKRALRYYWS